MVRVLLGLAEKPATDHEADALALAITYANRARTGLAAASGLAIPGRAGRRRGGHGHRAWQR